MEKSPTKQLFFILLVLSLISIAFVFPYVLTLQGDLLRQVNQPLALIFIAQFIQSGILFSLVIALGLFFTRKINFQLPLLQAILKRSNYQKILKEILPISLVAGIATAVSIYAVDSLFTLLKVNISTHQNYAPVWQKLLAAFYGGITEEILMRLFLMSLFIWISTKLFRQHQPSHPGILVSIVLAAAIFGLGHLPVTAAITDLTPLVVLRAVILNGIGGLVFGWLFWKKGLESAMIAHFTTDIFLLTLLPLLLN